MKKTSLIPTLLFAVSLPVCLGGCGKAEPYRHDSFTFDTFVSFSIYETGDGISAEEVCAGAVGMLNELDDTLSRTKAGSEISKINKNAGSGKVTVDTSTYNLLKSCTELSRLTDGAFDITLGDISDMWGFGTENPPMPDGDELKKLAGKHSYRNIEFDDENTSVCFTDGGFSLDLGAAAKGYAMDMLDSYLRKSGVTSAVVDFGGSILTIGKDNGNSRRISITADETNTPVGTLTVDEGYIATSNGANRYVKHNGKKYIHIIDPTTAYPADNGIKSCTVYSASGLISDALSTAFFVMGEEKTAEFYEKYNIAEYIITRNDGTVSVSDGISADFKAS